MHYSFRPALALALLALLAALFLAPVPAPAQSDRPQRLFLPAVVNGAPGSSVFGMEMYRLNADRGIDLVKASGTRWVRRNALLWKTVEPNRGEPYSWDHSSIQELEQEMIRASELKLNLVLVVHGSPGWAVIPHVAGCAPINARSYADFARFMAALVARYSQAPYNLRYIEIGNEPDAPVVTSEEQPYGCWGDTRDPYYGGRSYGEMLKAVVPTMKAVNPSIQVMNGGLLLDQPYDPAHAATAPGRFFEGMLQAGAVSYLDIISFHTYVFWYTPGQPRLGPREDWRVAYLNNLMRAYGIPPKPLLRTETALLCTAVTAECRWGQADMLVRSFVRTMRDGLLGTLWYIYDQDGFHNTALIEPSDVFVPRPAYFAYRHTGQLLSGARYVGPIPNLLPTVEGYRFELDARVIYAFWTDEPAGVEFPVVLPAGARFRCTKRDGGAFYCATEADKLWLKAVESPAFVEVWP